MRKIVNLLFKILMAGMVMTFVFTCIPFEGTLSEVREKAGGDGDEDGDGDDFDIPLLINLNEVEEYLSAQAGGNLPTNPVPLRLELDLGNMTNVNHNWLKLIELIDTKGKFVDLDLAGCAMSASNVFSPYKATATGEFYIVGLTLPDAARGIADGTNESPTFLHFSNLKSIIGELVVTIGSSSFCGQKDGDSWKGGNELTIDFPRAGFIGEYAFAHRALPPYYSVLFPNVTVIGDHAFESCPFQSAKFPTTYDLTIGSYAFSGCYNLNELEIPKAVSIGSYAFSGCYFLENVIAPEVTRIGDSAFEGCFRLADVNFNEVVFIGDNAFYRCAFEELSLPKLIMAGDYAFHECAFTTLNLPEVWTIGEYAFKDCQKLESLYMPSVERIGRCAFYFSYGGGTDLCITLGEEPPIVGDNLFYHLTAAKEVTVMIPSTTKAKYGPTPVKEKINDKTWGNAFWYMGYDPDNSAWAVNGGYGHGAGINPPVNNEVDKEIVMEIIFDYY